MYRQRLESYSKMKAVRDGKAASEPPGLSPEVIDRLYNLKGIEQYLMDPKRQTRPREAERAESNLINLRGLMEAYRSKEIEWHEGKVILFYKGKALGPWKRRTMEEITELCLSHENRVWVEGVSFHRRVLKLGCGIYTNILGTNV